MPRWFHDHGRTGMLGHSRVARDHRGRGLPRRRNAGYGHAARLQPPRRPRDLPRTGPELRRDDAGRRPGAAAPARPGKHPLIVMLHGFGNDKHACRITFSVFSVLHARAWLSAFRSRPCPPFGCRPVSQRESGQLSGHFPQPFEARPSSGCRAPQALSALDEPGERARRCGWRARLRTDTARPREPRFELAGCSQGGRPRPTAGAEHSLRSAEPLEDAPGSLHTRRRGVAFAQPRCFLSLRQRLRVEEAPPRGATLSRR